jgi:hypothetical protein
LEETVIEKRKLSTVSDDETSPELASGSAGSANGGEPPTLAAVEVEIEAALADGELSLAEKFDWFEKKLKAALTDRSASASELGKILGETDNAIAAAEQEALAARERALDPVVSPDLAQARDSMESAAFYVGRLQTQQPRLLRRYQETVLKEQVQTYLTKLRELAPERDALAAELRTTYETATAELTGLFQRVRIFEQRARSALGSPPANCAVLERIDTRVLDKCTLPDWQHPDRNLWPPPADFSAFAASMTIPSVGAAWADPVVQERQRAERAAEQERMARHYAAQAAEQLERENRQLRENWEASQRRA